MLLPLVAAGGAPAVLAVLIGVNIGPNLTYTGSLATMLWRRVVHQHDEVTSLKQFTALGHTDGPGRIDCGRGGVVGIAEAVRELRHDAI